MDAGISRVVVAAVLRGGRKAELAAEYEALLRESPPTAEGLYDAGVIAHEYGHHVLRESAVGGIVRR
jgi:hypothetical protein